MLDQIQVEAGKLTSVNSTISSAPGGMIYLPIENGSIEQPGKVLIDLDTQ